MGETEVLALQALKLVREGFRADQAAAIVAAASPQPYKSFREFNQRVIEIENALVPLIRGEGERPSLFLPSPPPHRVGIFF